jgi:hypothetical protein
MAKISILDTGYVKPTNEGTRLVSANMSNAGAAIALKAVVFKPTSMQKVDDTPSLGVYGIGNQIDSFGSAGNLASVENPKFTLSGVLDLTETADQDLVMPLFTLALTKGYKVLYYDSATDDAAKQLVYQLATDTFTSGESTAYTVTSGLKHLHCRILSCDFIDTAGTDKLAYNLKGLIIKSETSTI